MPEPAPARARVAIVLSHDISMDAVARRRALALAGTGLDVTILTRRSVEPGSIAAAQRSLIGGVHVQRLDTPGVLSTTRDRRRRRHRARMRRLVHRDKAEAGAMRARLDILALRAGNGRKAWNGVIVATRSLVRVRRLGRRVVDAARRRSRRRFDRLVARSAIGASWRRDLLEANDHELALGPELDRLAPDVIHARGPLALGVAARATARARLQGREVPWLYDATEDLGPTSSRTAASARKIAVGRQLEDEYAGHAWRVLADDRTVANRLEDRLRRRVDVVEPLDGQGRLDRTAAETLAAVYRDLLGPDRVGAMPDSALTDTFERPVLPPRPASSAPLVGFGPANMAGQAWAWAKALERHVAGARTEVLMVDRGSPLGFPADELVLAATYARDVSWQLRTRDRVLGTWSHAVLEAGRPIMGTLYGQTFANDARVMGDAGIRVGLVFHGSELRDPRRHAQRHRWSPFLDDTDPWVAKVQAAVDLIRPQIDEFSGPCLVSTPDLLEYLPRAEWVPVVVDVASWTPGARVMERAVPVVIHAPSRAAIKGSTHVEKAVGPLVDAGIIDYRRISAVRPDRMPAVLREADVVLDQFAIGSYGVLAVQAMAAGRVVVGDVTDDVRRHVRDATGMTVPIVQATPDTLTSVLRDLAGDVETAHRSAQAGPDFVAAVHDGALAAAALARALGLPLRPRAEGG
ncbi:MAG TPA: hypothetical protein VFG96_04055 [Jiangellaceae bacterium]|nr:hypothetical protein [Jiangellaceae bacterium]